MLTSQLKFWEQERRKRSAKRHTRGTRSRRGCYKHRRKSRRYSPTPKPSKRTPKKVHSEEPATDSQEKLPTTDEQLCSTDETFKAITLQQQHLSVTPPLISDPLQSHGAKPPAAVPWSTGNQRRAQACKRGGTDLLESAKKIPSKPHQDSHPTPYTPDEPPSRPSEHFTEYPVNQIASHTAEPPAAAPWSTQPPPPLTSDPPPPIEHTTPPTPHAWTFRAILLTEHSNVLNFFTLRLSELPGITEVTKEETTDGPHTHTAIRIKGSEQALYEAQRNLASSEQYDITWEEDPPALAGTTNTNRWQTTTWEADKT